MGRGSGHLMSASGTRPGPGLFLRVALPAFAGLAMFAAPLPAAIDERGFPSVESVSPSVIRQGETASLLLKVWKVELPGCAFDFGPGTRVLSSPAPRWDGPNAVRLSLKVDVSAAVGPRDFHVSCTDWTTQKAGVRIFVSPAPDVLSVSPGAVKRGERVQLRLVVRDFDELPRLSFGRGIDVVGGPTFKDDDIRHQTVTVKVASDAPLGRRKITIENGPEPRTATASLQVVEAPAPPPGPPPPPEAVAPTETSTSEKVFRPPSRPAGPGILALSPNVWRPGTTYDLKIVGRALAAGFQVRFGEGVTVRGEPRVTTPMQATVTVAVAADASPGERRAEISPGKGQDFSPAEATARVVAAAEELSRKRPEEVVPLYEPSIVVPAPGSITLIAPEPWAADAAAGGGVFNDHTIFSWQEENPGLAEEFELRVVFLEEDGSATPLLTRRIRPREGASLPPAHYLPDGAFFDQLMTGAFKTRTFSGPIGPRVMHWQVAGYRSVARYGFAAEEPDPSPVPGKPGPTRAPPEVRAGGRSQPAAAKVGQTQLLVEESELRPLRHPVQPLGLQCTGDPSSATPEGSRDAHDIKVSPPPDGVAYHPSDPVELSGTVALADLPYAQFSHNYSEPEWTVHFQNVFVDWGDRTGAERVMLRGASELYHLSHRYVQPGTYVLRVFMLPLRDANANDPSLVASSVDTEGSTSPEAWYDGPGQFGGSEAADLARRAYLLHCSSMAVIPRKDPVSDGPLRLEAVTITGFNGSGKAQPQVAGTAAPRAGLATTVQSPAVRTLPEAAKGLQPAPDSPALPAFGECSSVQGDAVLSYYGCGSVRVEWRLEDLDSGASVDISTGDVVRVGPSPARADLPGPLSDEERAELEALDADGQKDSLTAHGSPPPLLGSLALSSPVVKLRAEQVGRRFALRVSATVVNHCQDLAVVADSPRELAPGAAGARPVSQQASRNRPQGSKTAGVLSPYREGASGRTGVGYVDPDAAGTPAAAALPGDAEKASKPVYVESEPRPFRVAESDPGKPCRFRFTTADGGFEVDTLSDLRDLGGGRWNGRGVFHYVFPEDPTKKEKLAPVAFSSWLAPDGYQVIEGALDLKAPDDEIGARGMRIRIASLSGAAGPSGSVTLALSASLPETLLAGRKLSWSAAAALSSAGDWIAAAGAVERVPLAYSGHEIESGAAFLDLSGAANLQEPSPGCGTGATWMGFHFGGARLFPNTLGLAARSGYDAPGWVAGPSGLCGRTLMPMSGGPARFKRGILGWSSIEAVADGRGSVRTIYEGFTATVPAPFDVTLAGTVVLLDQPGREPFPSFAAMTGPERVERSYPTPAGGRVGLAASGFGLGVHGALGWGIKANVDLAFEFEGRRLADFSAGPLVESFDGLLHRPGGDRGAVTIPLGSGTVVGENIPAVVESVLVSGAGTSAIDFGFALKVRISEKLSETPMPVGYRLVQGQDGAYSGFGPIAAPFEQEVVYNGGGSEGVASTVRLSLAKGDDGSSGAGKKSGPFNCMSGDVFCGETPGFKIMGAGVKALFRLGYKGGTDYFALMADASGMNVPLPPAFALYGVRGGLAHNFKLTDFVQTRKSILEIEPDMGGDYVFVAGLAAGLASDPALLSFDATLLISTGEQPMLTFKAWVLSESGEKEERTGKTDETRKGKQSESGDVWGFFTVGAGGFDGAIAGDKGFVKNKLRVRMPGDTGCYSRPSVREVVACARSSWASVLHFGGLTDWYVYIGRKGGPRVEAVLLDLFKPQAYVQLQSVGGLAFGASWDLTKQVEGWGFRVGFSLGASFDGAIMWPSPFGIAAEARQWAKVFACYEDWCLEPGVDLWMRMEFSTARTLLAAGFQIDDICPFEYVKFGLQILPSPALEAEVNWCDWIIF